MAVPPMIGVPEAGGYVFYSGSRELFERHQETQGVRPTPPTLARTRASRPCTTWPCSARYGMFAGAAHAFALIRREDIKSAALALLLADWSAVVR